MNAEKDRVTKKIKHLSIITFPIFTLVINLIYFGGNYYSSISNFLIFTGGAIFFFVPFSIFAKTLGMYCFAKWPGELNLKKRLTANIFIKTIISFFLLYAAVRIADRVSLHPYNPERFLWVFLAQSILNIFMTFMAEGFAQFGEWEKNYAEAEKLKNVYKVSQLNGLKSQVNPHFLFNSLNSLSSLIQEDEEKAEIFLDEMSKVYRYMLRTDEEQLVTLETELQFAASYMHLLKTRYGEGLRLDIAINEQDKEKLLPPLTLQVIIENAIMQNIIRKSTPLIIQINATGYGGLKIQNNIQVKAVTDTLDLEAGLDNLLKRYELMNQPISVDDSSKQYRVIELPLITRDINEVI